MRYIDSGDVYSALKPALLHMNRKLPDDVFAALRRALEGLADKFGAARSAAEAAVAANGAVNGTVQTDLSCKMSGLTSKVLAGIVENCEIAAADALPICQDTGLVMMFVDIGTQVMVRPGPVHFQKNEGCAENNPPDDCNNCNYSKGPRGRAGMVYSDDPLAEALYSAVADAWQKGYFRASMVTDPLNGRQNSGTNLPPVIYYQRVPGDRLTISCLAKGFGSENWSKVLMLKPTAGRTGVVEAVTRVMEEAGGSPCPPVVLGVGIGGTMDYAAWLSKRALLRKLDDEHPDPYYRDLESELLERINRLPIGPGGLGNLAGLGSLGGLSEDAEVAEGRDAGGIGDNNAGSSTYTALAVKVEHYPTHIAGLPVAVSVNCWADRKCVVEL